MYTDTPAHSVADATRLHDPGDADATRLHDPGDLDASRAQDSGDAGQTTAEYALVLLGAAAIAAVLLKWAASASGLTKLFTAVLHRLIQGIGG
jgi:hypothetical protein